MGYILGMVKMEAFDDSHFMHQAVRGGHTEHTGSSFLSNASLILKIFFYGTLIKIALCLWALVC